MAKKADDIAKRRVRAGKMLQRGLTPAEVAAGVGVARQPVSPWKRVFDEGGLDALRKTQRRGPQSKLDEAASAFQCHVNL